MIPVTIGADPEIFFGSETDVPVSAETFIPGVKHNPHVVGEIEVMVDNVAAEFAVSPSVDRMEFVEKIK